MKCHYEVLNIPREASATEIKTAYRKLALQWHPDKNLDNLQEAKEQFQLLQNAYEVLSDPQERAWYDRHREQLLRGSGSSYNDDSLDVFPYFSPSCYKGFGDDPQGFYGVYNEVFSKLAAEETDFLDDPEDLKKIPKFGNSSTPYEDVHEFYAYWMSFSTNKSFVWLDQYAVQQGDNRRVIKIMEKENNKLRQKARKERNEEIRRLVSFVRRRDKRVQEHSKQLQEKAEENKRKAEQIRRERIMQRQKEIEEAKQKAGESSFLNSDEYQKKLSEIESLVQEEFGLSSDDDTISEGGMESSNEDSSRTEEANEKTKATPKSSRSKQSSVKNLYCSACNKLFKNVKSFENHENSKKHKENVLNMALDEDIGLSDEDSITSDDRVNGRPGEANTEDVDVEDEARDEVVDGERDVGRPVLTVDNDDIDEGESRGDESENPEVMTKSQKRRTKKKKQLVPPESEGNDSHDEMSFEIEMPSRSRRAKKFTALKSQTQAKKDQTQAKKDQTQAKRDQTQDKKEQKKVPTSQTSTETMDPEDGEDENAKMRQVKNKKIEKRGKKEDEVEIHRCVVCKSDFPSKNKLFEHLKTTGHQVPLPSCSDIPKKGKRAR